VDGEHYRGAGRLVEVEVVGQVAEDLRLFTDIRPRVGPSVARRVETLAVEEVVFDELVVRVEAQRLVIDIARLRVRADDQTRYAQPRTVVVIQSTTRS